MPQNIEVHILTLKKSGSLDKQKLDITIVAFLDRWEQIWHTPNEPDIKTLESEPLQEVIISVTGHPDIIRRDFNGKKTISIELISPGMKTVTVTAKDNRAFHPRGTVTSKTVNKKINIVKWKPPQSEVKSIKELKTDNPESKRIEISGTSISSEPIMEVSYKLNTSDFISFEGIENSNLKNLNWKGIIQGVRSGNNTIVIRAKDFFGNFSDLRKDFVVGPPTTIIIFPPNTNDGEGRYDNINWDREAKKASITIKGNTTDPTTNIKSIQWRFKRNDNQVQDELKNVSIISSQSVKWEFEVIMLRPEHHSIEVVAKDNAGNEEKIFVYVGVRS